MQGEFGEQLQVIVLQLAFEGCRGLHVLVLQVQHGRHADAEIKVHRVADGVVRHRYLFIVQAQAGGKGEPFGEEVVECRLVVDRSAQYRSVKVAADAECRVVHRQRHPGGFGA